MLEFKYIITAHVGRRFRQGASAPCLPSLIPSVEATRAFQYLIIITESPVLPGWRLQEPALSLLLERAGLLSFPASFRTKSRLLPLGAALLALPAGSGTFMSAFYSCGLFPVHNVEPCFPGLWPGYLDLSNTLVSRKTLSSSKPPEQESSFAAFPHVLDGIPSPGRGNRRNPSGFRYTCSARFRTVPS